MPSSPGRPNISLDAAVAEARERYAAARPASAAQHGRARRHMPGGNTRSVLFYTPFPTAMAGGESCHLTDQPCAPGGLPKRRAHCRN